MPKKKDDYPYTWNDFEGKIAPEVLCAPRTCGDPSGDWSEVHPRVIGYLMRNVQGKPWADHLTLIAAVLSAQRRDVGTVEVQVRTLHARFSVLFPLFELDNVRQWSIDQHLIPYVRGEVPLQDTLSTRVSFFKRYTGMTNLVANWLDFLPEAQQELYRSFLLPTVNPLLAETLSKWEQEWEERRKDERKEETEAVVPQFTALRAEAHLRFNKMTRLRQAYQQALVQVLPDHSNLPLEFSYEEGDPPVERIQCRLWDRRSFVLYPEHAAKYHQETVRNARRKRIQFTDNHNTVFLELVKAERLGRDEPAEGLWFTDLLKLGMLGAKPSIGTEQEVAKKQAWLREWGYGEENLKEIIRPFEARHQGLLDWPDAESKGAGLFISGAQQRTDRTLIPVESLYATTTFGLLALELLTTTGMRINELQQVSLLPECIIRMVDDAPPGAKDQTPRIRYVLRLLPKGERTEKRHHYGIGKDGLRLMTQTAHMLCEHYHLKPREQLPRVEFTSDSGRR